MVHNQMINNCLTITKYKFKSFFGFHHLIILIYRDVNLKEHEPDILNK
jgi:hypothetical protein